MAKFTYKGHTREGTSVQETVEAPDRFMVYEIARENGHSVTAITEVKKFSFSQIIKTDRIDYFLSKVKLDELVMMTHNIGSMLKAGLQLSRALSVIERQTKNPRLKGIMREVREDIGKGKQFNEALKEYPETFSRLYVAMVRAGEESGGLATTLNNIGTQLERSANLRKKIKGAMIYPAIVVTVMVIIGVLLMIYVLPTITATFVNMNITLPLSTRILIGSTAFMSENALLVIAGIIAVIAGFIAFSRTAVGKRTVHRALIHLPVIGVLVKETNAAYTARTLSSLLASGVDVISALSITEDVLQNVHYKAIVSEAAKKVEKGSPLSETFLVYDNRYPILVGEMMLVGEETGQVSQMLAEIAMFYENEVERKTKDLSTIIEPMLMVVIGSTVGFFALAMIAPIYSIGDSIK